MPPSISVVIPIYNAAQTLDACLAALANQEYDGAWEVVVADNGSRDGSAEMARGWSDRFPRFQVIDASHRRGVSHARNIGARSARGELILLTDADDVVAPGWLAAFAEAAPTADLLTGGFDEATLNEPLHQAWRPTRGTPDQVRPLSFLPFAVGSNCGVRREVFNELDGWDERYRGGGDDVEFSWRVQLAGYRLGYVPKAIVRTRYRTSLRELAKQYFYRGRADARLYRDFRRSGARREPMLHALRGWAGLVSRLPWLLHPESRGAWLRIAAARLGRIRGRVGLRVRNFVSARTILPRSLWNTHKGSAWSF